MVANESVSPNDVSASPQDVATQQALTLAYDQVIGRDPTPTELALNQQQLQGGTTLAAIRSYLATTGYAVTPLVQTYTDVAGRAVTAPELAADQGYLDNGGSLAGLRSYFATTTEATSKLQALYTNVVGRAVTAPELTADQKYLTDGGSLANLRSYFATTTEAVGKLQALYTDVVGRSITASELSSNAAAIGAGMATLGGLRNYFATTSETVGKLQSLYTTELNRAITPGEMAADEQIIASGGSLVAIRGYLSTSQEAVGALTVELQGAFTHSPQAPADLVSSEQALAGGTSLAAAVVGTAASSTYINATYQSLLGVPPTAAEVSTIKQGVTDFLTKFYPSQYNDSTPHPNPPYIDVQSSFLSVAAASPEFTNDVNAAFQAAVGRQANAVELAADQSELSAGFNINSIRTQIAELSGGAPPTPATDGQTIAITPQTIAGSPNLIYGLLHNDAFISSSVTALPDRASVIGSLTNPGGGSVNPPYDVGSRMFDFAGTIFQIESRQAASFGDLSFSQVTGSGYAPTYTVITFKNDPNVTITAYAPQTSFTAANFRFV